MAAQKGREMLIKVNDGSSPENFSTVAGVRSRTITINNEQVDITDSDNAPWRTLLADAGLRSISITASGVFKDDTAMRKITDEAYNGTLESYQIVFPNGDTLDGEFQISSLEEAGEHTGERTYSISMESSGAGTFVRA